MVEPDLGLAALPAEEDDLAPDVPVEVDRPRLELLHFDPLLAETVHRLLEPAGEVAPFGVEPGLELVVDLVFRVHVGSPEVGESLLLRVHLREAYDPAAEAGQELVQVGETAVRLVGGPPARRNGAFGALGRHGPAPLSVPKDAGTLFTPTMSVG